MGMKYSGTKELLQAYSRNHRLIYILIQESKNASVMAAQIILELKLCVNGTPSNTLKSLRWLIAIGKRTLSCCPCERLIPLKQAASVTFCSSLSEDHGRYGNGERLPILIDGYRIDLARKATNSVNRASLAGMHSSTCFHLYKCMKLTNRFSPEL